MRKRTEIGVVLTGAAMLMAMLTPCYAGDDAISATEWGNADSDSVTPAGDVTIHFASVGAFGFPESRELIIGGTSPSSAFKGDISGYTAIRFNVTGDGSVPGTLRVNVTAPVTYDSDRIWLNTTPRVSGVAGEWMLNTVPFVIDQGWTSTFKFENWAYTPSESWAMDLKVVKVMSLTIAPSGDSAQSYSISKCQLVTDSGATVAAQLTPLQAYFDGVSSVDDLTDEQLAQDTDGDGMSDLNEIIAGMDPLDGSSVLAAQVEKAEDGSMVVSWDGVLGANYGILRSSDLSSGFDLIEADIACATTGPMSYKDSSPVAGKANFYKIVKY